MERFPQMEFNRNLLRLELSRKPPESPFILSRWYAEDELPTKVTADLPDASLHFLRVRSLMTLKTGIEPLDDLLGRAMHADQKATCSKDAFVVLLDEIARQTIDGRGDLPPASEVEVADAEVGALHALI